jgi:Uma2 family endonuclease
MNAIAEPLHTIPTKPHSNGAVSHPLPDPYSEGDGDRLFEVVRGRRVEKTMGLVQNRIAAILYGFLAPFCRQHNLGHVDIEAPFSIPNSGNDRKPDVAFVSFQKWAKERPLPDVNAWPIAPDLAVEVVSPSDRAFDVLEKVHEYFNGGVQQVWQIYSNVKQAWIYASPSKIRIHTTSDMLCGDPIVPGFQIAVADLFPLVEVKK